MPSHKQEKERTMKQIIALAILVGTSLGMVAQASAQEAVVDVKIPFDFTVNNEALPAGEYQIAASGGFLQFTNKAAKVSVFANAIQGDTSTDGKDLLTFDVADGQHFLRKISSESATTSADFPRSKLERRAQELRASHESVVATMGR
jgi:hypothetical protein